ncbi:MAG: GAF domain-containing protein [Acaryochloris sp. RU_4_1]|nr:GAF domain-containing protein [Acaryochloris sp. SU_5_25]NJM65119.1 GAF domain-containing protein [Acaryochloris sp. RU_4_1]NJR54077.1 GAF domain-containing protein [Acaryochloris sp. CRU_2_0]
MANDDLVPLNLSHIQPPEEQLAEHCPQDTEAVLKAQLQQAVLLAQITNEIRQSLETPVIFQTAVKEVWELLQADRVAIFRLDPGANYTKGVFVAERVGSAFDSALAAQVQDDCFGHNCAAKYRLGRVLATPDIYNAGLSDCHIHILARFQVRANLVIPLLEGEKLWGLLCIHQCSEPRVWQTAEIEFMQKVATQLSIALKQAALLTESQRRTQELQETLIYLNAQIEREALLAQHERHVAQIIQLIRQSLDVDEIFQTTTQEVRQSLKCDRVVVYRFFPDWSGEFVFEAGEPHLLPLATAHQTTQWQDTYLQNTRGGQYRDNATTVVADIYQQSYSDCHLEMLERFEIRAFMIVPVFVGNTLWGLLAAYQNHVRPWHTLELNLLKQVGLHLGVALQQAELLQQLREAKTKAEAANQAKSAFLAHMSHELRTPLNAILGFSQLLGRDESLTPTQQQTLDTINRSGAHLLNLINDVLEMSRIEAGKASLNVNDFDLHVLFASLYEMFSLKAQSRHLCFEFDIPADLPRFVKGDESRLRQVLINLLGNALKFTEMGSVHLAVAWTCLMPENNPGECHPTPEVGDLSQKPGDPHSQQIRLHIMVKDTGVGIAAEELTHLFEAFAQAAGGRQSSEGAGLGLAISQQFVRLMQGNITIDSQFGQGTLVQLQIPVVMTASSGALVECYPQKITGFAPDQADWRILIAEDHPENRELLMNLLEGIGFQVQAVENGEAAIALWQTWCPHLILMDWQMPIMDGYHTTQQIRQLEGQTQSFQLSTQGGLLTSPSPNLDTANSRVKTIILALTANVFEEVQQNCQDAGCDDFIGKPFQLNILLETIATHLGVRYIYEPPQQMIAGRNNHSTQSYSSVDIAQQLSVWPRTQLLTLEKAAIELDEVQVHHQLSAIQAEHPDLGLTLMRFFKGLQLDKIADCAHQALMLQKISEKI